MPRHASLLALAALALLATTGCSGNPDQGDDEVVASSSEELISCGWLAGGDCTNIPWGDWRSPYFWADVYLAKFATQRKQFNEHIEPGPPRLAKPRTVVLVTGVTIRAAW